MWRDGGEGEVYAYLPHSKQRQSLCDDKENICNPDYGFSLGRGTFSFPTGKWVSVRQVLKMNTAGKRNGEITIYLNGKRKMHEKQLVFRINSSDKVVGISKSHFYNSNEKIMYILT
jgi:hypothetical protein